MADQIIILVSDRGDEKHGEITVLDDSAKAERLVETLLEAGFEQERIRVFHGSDVPMKVTYRPVVEIPDGGDNSSRRGDDPSGEGVEAELPAVQSAAEVPSGATPVTAHLRATPVFSSHLRPSGLRLPRAGLQKGGADVIS